MKRTVAIMLAVLVFAFSLTGCNGRNGGNVSDTTNGTVSSSGERRSTAANGESQRNSQSTYRERTAGDSGFMNDMENAAREAGNAMGDAGKAVGDAVTGNDSTPGTGMTGGR